MFKRQEPEKQLELNEHQTRTEQQTQYQGEGQGQQNIGQPYQLNIIDKQLQLQYSKKLPPIHKKNNTIATGQKPKPFEKMPQIRQAQIIENPNRYTNIILPSLQNKTQQDKEICKQYESLKNQGSRQISQSVISTKKQEQKSAKQSQIAQQQATPQILKSTQQKIEAQNICHHDTNTDTTLQKQKQSQKLSAVAQPPQAYEIACKQIVETEHQQVSRFDENSKSSSILFEDTDHSSAFQSQLYYENHKIVLTQPIFSLNSTCKFRIENIKYCIGFGVALKQVIEKHQYDYLSEGSNQLGHGLYIVTSQGFSWSHSQKNQDDIARAGFNQMYNGLEVEVKFIGQEIQFKWKKGEFKLTFPSLLRQKYTVCFCAYLHEKQDAVSISK